MGKSAVNIFQSYVHLPEGTFVGAPCKWPCSIAMLKYQKVNIPVVLRKHPFGAGIRNHCIPSAVGIDLMLEIWGAAFVPFMEEAIVQ